MKSFKLVRNLSFAITLLTILVAALGLFYFNDGNTFFAQNVFGDKVKMFGNGIYENEAYFKAPILKGTDAFTLFITVPIFLILTIRVKENSYKYRLLHLSFLALLLYYAISLGFGVALNIIYPFYILLFSLSLIAFITSISSFDIKGVVDYIKPDFPHKSIAVFLILAGCSVFVWLIEIVAFIKTGKAPETMGMNLNELSFILDLGIIAPTAFIASYSLIKRKPLGYLLSAIILTLNALIGPMVILQSIFQKIYGIDIDIKAAIAYVGIFVVMSFFATLLNIKLLKNIES